MIRGSCPTCKTRFEVATIDDLPSFPFCSDRCRLIDLGRWIDGTHRIPGPPVPPEGQNPGDEDAED